MRSRADAQLIQRFMATLGAAATADATCYLAGGATAVLLGWRRSTLDIDVALDPERDDLLRALARAKDELGVNVELAAPGDFVPLPDGWRERSPFAAREGSVTFRHFDPYAQALAKLERGHRQDVEDVRSLVDSGLVGPERLRELFREIEPELYRFPAIDPREFRAAVDALATP